MSRFGPHIDPPLAHIPPALRELGLSAFQTTLRDPRRLSKESVPDEADQAAFREAATLVPDLWGIVHASLLTSLASPDPRVRNGSAGALVADANLAGSLGMAGVCFHAGYQKGHDARDAALQAVAYKLGDSLTKLKPGGRLLLENSCEGTELCQTVAEIGFVVQALNTNATQFGIILDTCHLHVAGFDLAAPAAPERLAAELEEAGLAPFLTALHLNDAREACGSHRDRHAVPGQGTIGEGLRRLLAHPLFAPLPCILEMSLDDALAGIAFMQEAGL